jgi:hypothetical protein
VALSIGSSSSCARPRLLPRAFLYRLWEFSALRAVGAEETIHFQPILVLWPEDPVMPLVLNGLDLGWVRLPGQRRMVVGQSDFHREGADSTPDEPRMQVQRPLEENASEYEDHGSNHRDYGEPCKNSYGNQEMLRIICCKLGKQHEKHH